MLTLLKRSITALIIGSAFGSFAFAGVALAKDGGSRHGRENGREHAGRLQSRIDAVGTVASAPDASGTFTLNAQNREREGDENAATATLFTVTTATSTEVRKNDATVSVSALAAGDFVRVRGTLTAPNVIRATRIRELAALPEVEREHRAENIQNVPAAIALQLPSIVGTGQPILGGTVTAVGTTTLSITNKSNVHFSVDAMNAKVFKNNATSSLTSVSTGDAVFVQGTVNGSSVVASTILDQGPAPATTTGMAGRIRSFLSRLFGFF